MKALAIDFETAHGFQAIFGLEPVQPACAIGVAGLTEHGPELVFYSLIRPDPFIMDEDARRVHGISLEDLKTAPSFQTLWSGRLGKLLCSADRLIAHNADFDMRVLRHALSFYGFAAQSQSWDVYDTLKAAREMWTGKHTLDACCERINFRLDHHHAGSDALGCAALYQAFEGAGSQAKLF